MPPAWQPRDGIAKAKLDARGKRLCLELLIEGARLASSTNEIEERFRRPVHVLAPRGIEEDALVARLRREVKIHSHRLELFQDVLRRRPVLDALQIAMEAGANFRTLLVHDGAPAGPGKREGRRQTSGSGTDDVDRVVCDVGHRVGPIVNRLGGLRVPSFARNPEVGPPGVSAPATSRRMQALPERGERRSSSSGTD